MKKTVLMSLVVAVITFSGCNSKEAQELNSSKDVATQQTVAHEVVNSNENKNETLVVLKTNQGDITLKMFPEVAPLAVENFVTHAKEGYYDGLTFHRVIKGFMIQGGDPTGTGMGGESIWKKEFVNEYAPNVVFDKPYLLAMANHGVNTNGSQFFITTVPTPHLNGGYTIFGEVVSGQDVVRKIENVRTGRGDRPIEEQKMIKVTVK